MKTPAPFRSAVVAIAMLAAAATAAQAGTASPLLLTFVNENTTYAADDAWILFSYTGTTANEFVGDVIGGPKSGPITFTAGAGKSSGSYFSEVFRITDLAGGVSISKTPSTRIYVSLGKELDDAADASTPDNPFSLFGSPSPTDPNDPNWNTRWDFFETTLSDPRAATDYGDISAINQFAIPLKVELYDSTLQTPDHLLQSAQSATDTGGMARQLRALAGPYLANNNSTLAGRWYFDTPSEPPTPENPYPGTFLRMVGPASGGTDPEWIGPFPSMNDYATFVANAPGVPISATLTDTTSVASAVQQEYQMTTTAWFTGDVLSGIKVSGTIKTWTWDHDTSTWINPTTDPRTYEMRIALDTDVGHPDANYSLSNALYGSAWQNNTGVTFWTLEGLTETSHTQAEFLTAVSSNATMALQTVNQWMQNLFVGYNFGLVGNTQTVSNLPGGHSLIGVTLNDMGSEGWAELKALIRVGTIATSDVPFFTLKDAQQRPLYNQWAKIVFDNSETVYGTQYSDMFQPLLALYTYQSNFVNNVYQPTPQDVLSWKVTILAPEPGAIATVATALGALVAASRLRRRRA
jgi:hypothetical protein